MENEIKIYAEMLRRYSPHPLMISEDYAKACRDVGDTLLQMYEDARLKGLQALFGKTPANDVETARKHHKKHGDMDGHICLLNECALHYPKYTSSTQSTNEAVDE